MSYYILKSVRTNLGLNVTEGKFEHQMNALTKLKQLAQDQDCLFAEVEWWKHAIPKSENPVVVIAQAERDGLAWRIAIGQLQPLSGSIEASKMLKRARDRPVSFADITQSL
jgi:hypothetical protein